MMEIRVTGTKEELTEFFNRISTDEEIKISEVNNSFFHNQIGKTRYMGFLNVSMSKRDSAKSS